MSQLLDGGLFAAGPPATTRLFTTLLTSGAMTRTQLGAHTGLSAGAVTKALRPLLDRGLIRELTSSETPSSAGRPAIPLDVDAEHAHLVGVKVTADEAIGVVTDLRARVLEVRRARLPTIVDRDAHTHRVDPDDAIGVIARLITDLATIRPVSGVGIAVTGDVDPDIGVVRFAPLLGWRGISLADRLTELTGLPTALENDVRAVTVDAQWFGAGRCCSTFAVITLGTGSDAAWS